MKPFTRLGRTIRALREARRWTQLTLAHQMGLKGAGAGTVVNRLENGKQSPTFKTLEKLSKALKVPVSELVGEGK
jgi:transcriptional regulator with XRE-family HTH domain